MADFSHSLPLSDIIFNVDIFFTNSAQESSGKTGVLGPTKIYLAVQPAQPVAGTANSSQPPPLAPVQSPHQVSIY